MQAEDYGRMEYIVHEFISLRLISPRMDPERFAQLLSQWLQSQTGSLPGVLALDGKMIRNIIGMMTSWLIVFLPTPDSHRLD
jgi:hypothetical protein